MFSRQIRIWSFHVVVLPRMAKKCTKNYNAKAQPLFCYLIFCLATFPLPSWFLKLPSVNVKLSVFSVNKIFGIYFYIGLLQSLQLVIAVVTFCVY